MIDLNQLKYNADGLICAITQDAFNGEVLMQAYMNRESLQETINCGYATYYSRSRNQLWKKGETSGHLQRVIEIKFDCDADCLLLLVEQIGVACHTGAKSCFFNNLADFDYVADYKVVFDVANTIKERKANPQEGSYTNYLLNKGTAKICKKIGEESTEAVIAAIKGDKKELIGELADMLYHSLVLIENCEISVQDVFKELLIREGRAPHPKYADLDSDKGRNRENK